MLRAGVAEPGGSELFDRYEPLSLSEQTHCPTAKAQRMALGTTG